MSIGGPGFPWHSLAPALKWVYGPFLVGCNIINSLKVGAFAFMVRPVLP